MKSITGIYRITNLRNNKVYIGQSRNILARWKQHTQGLQHATSAEQSLIRKAFIKCGLTVPVTSIGEYHGFRFEIIEECPEGLLLEREQYYIKQEKPVYNLQMMPPQWDSESRAQPSRKPQLWIQYHNVDGQGCYPGHIWDEDEQGIPLVDAMHSISTRKRVVFNMVGDTIVMIAGVKIAQKKLFFAWSVMVTEEVDFCEAEDYPYNVLGHQTFFESPVLLNDIDGFSDFLKKQGNFAFGLNTVAKHPWGTILQRLVDTGPYVTDDSLSWVAWIKRFEQRYGLSILDTAHASPH